MVMLTFTYVFNTGFSIAIIGFDKHLVIAAPVVPFVLCTISSYSELDCQGSTPPWPLVIVLHDVHIN